jgi:hypothetical protein
MVEPRDSTGTIAHCGQFNSALVCNYLPSVSLESVCLPLNMTLSMESGTEHRVCLDVDMCRPPTAIRRHLFLLKTDLSVKEAAF